MRSKTTRRNTRPVGVNNPGLTKWLNQLRKRSLESVEAPERPTETIVQPNGDAKHEVQMPAVPPAIEEIPAPPKSRRWLLFLFSAMAISLVITNIALVLATDLISHL